MPRKGARRIAEIPAKILDDLNYGRLETANLVEWLAVDHAILVRQAARDVGLAREAERLARAAAEMSSLGIVQRMKGIGRALFELLKDDDRRTAVHVRLAHHPSDVVRSWSAYMIAYDPALGLDERIAAARPFAADSHMGVRETAWDVIRPSLAAELERGIALLLPWVSDDDARVRRCAIEATRPCGVWCTHLGELKECPQLGLPLLEPVRADDSAYVRRSVANWLNDASKSRPAWVRQIARLWLRESPLAATRWIVNHATRTLRKRSAGAAQEEEHSGLQDARHTKPRATYSGRPASRARKTPAARRRPRAGRPA